MRLPWRRRRHFDAPPKPIDQLLLEMMGRSSTSPVSRTEALSVPAVQRGRNMICGSIAAMPLVQHGPDNSVARSSLLEQLDPDIPNVTTLSQTLEDLLFGGLSWWLVTARDFAGFPIAVRHLDEATVSLQPPANGQNPAPLPSGVDPRGAVVWVDGEPVDKRRVIGFHSPNPAVLKVGGRAIRRAILLDQAASMYADDPRPLDYFTPGDGAELLDDDEEQRLLAKWKAARKAQTTAFIPASLQYHTVDTPSPAELQLVELQRQANLDIANALGIDPEDLGISTTSRTYSNDVDRRRNKLNEVLAPYMRAITDRLSMGDVTRRGYTVRFDTTEFLLPNPTERWATYQTAHDMGAITIDEIRAKEGQPPLPADVEPEPQEQPVEAHRPASMTFDAPGLTFADVPLVSFSVDKESRTIEGLALPYDRVASQGGLKFRFSQGSLQFTDVSRVKLLRDHDNKQPLGKAVALEDTPAGFLARFKVARGAAGDEALQLAEDGVLDGLSVGVDFDLRSDTARDRQGVQVVKRADLREVSLTAMPSFDDARVTSVAASRTQQGETMDEDAVVETAPEPQPVQSAPIAGEFSEDITEFLRQWKAARARTDELVEEPQFVDPARMLRLAVTNEALPYRFDRAGRFARSDHDFATDLVSMVKAGDMEGLHTEPGRRVMDLFAAKFTVETGDVNELNPTIQRPDMYVDQRDYRYPLWNAVNKGAPPNGVTPFTFPKFNSSSGLVSDHVEGTEPSSGNFTATGQTITPTALSGKVSITRETWDMGGNPAVSTLIFNQMRRAWFEGLEAATATFLNTLTAAADMLLTAGSQDTDLAESWTNAVVELQFARGYDFEFLALERYLYRAFANAVDESGGDGIGRPLFPMIGPTNANGTAAPRFRQLDLNGVVGIPSWALTSASASGSPNNSWLFDPTTVHGWATAPQRLEFPGTAAGGTYAPVAMIDLAIWGYKAFANSDIGGVRQVIYDPVA